MYEPPLLDFYDNAILNNGDPQSYNVGPLLRHGRGRAGVPGQPRHRRRPASCCRGRASTRSIRTSRRSTAWLSNVQVERALDAATSRSRSAT